ncbi:MAG: hypothetical protein PHP64_06105 [Actinomycetota bacterium]|nr:hypothetical protein [Actinomycetota bacterium]
MFGRMLLVAILVGVPVGLLVLFATALLSPRRSCPVCSASLPKLQFNKNMKKPLAREIMCKSCGAKFPVDSALKSHS